MSLPRSPFKRGRAVLLLFALLLAAGMGAGQMWLRGEAARGQVLARVKPALESRLGPVHIGDDFHIGWTGTVTLGPVELPGTRPEGPPVVRISRVTVHLRRLSLLSGRAEVAGGAVRGRRPHRDGVPGGPLRAARLHGPPQCTAAP